MVNERYRDITSTIGIVSVCRQPGNGSKLRLAGTLGVTGPGKLQNLHLRCSAVLSTKFGTDPI